MTTDITQTMTNYHTDKEPRDGDGWQPSPTQERVLDVIKEHPRFRPSLITKVTGMRRQDVNRALRDFRHFNWIARVQVETPEGDVEEIQGLYDFLGDPRDE